MTSCDFGDPAKPPFGLRNHSCRALHQWLINEPGIRVALLLLFGERPFNFIDAFPLALSMLASIRPIRFGFVEWATIAVRRHHFVGLEQHAPVRLVKQIDVPEAHRADRIAVIGSID